MTNFHRLGRRRRWTRRELAILLATIGATLGLPGQVTAQQTTSQQRATSGSHDFAAARRAMVEQDLSPAGIKSRGLLAALRVTPREEFIAPEFRTLAYEDLALPIGQGQTTAAPAIIAALIQRLDVRASDKVLEIGAGCGYETALLSRLAREVYGVEIAPELGKAAAERLDRLGYKNAQIKVGDGYQGWAEHAPFDKILLACSPETFPPPLVEQLREGGRMIAALGDRHQQTLYLLKKTRGQLVATTLEETFMPAMTGVANASRSAADDAPLSPLINGGFELESLRAGQPDGWHSLRQAQLDSTVLAGHGAQCLTFRNRQSGRSAAALQGIMVDGRRVRSLDLHAWVRCQETQSGKSPEQLPQILLTFLDESQSPVGEATVGPWEGTFSWCEKQSEVSVPLQARMALIAIGLFGAVGEASFDDIDIRTAPTVAQSPRLRLDDSSATRPLIR